MYQNNFDPIAVHIFYISAKLAIISFVASKFFRISLYRLGLFLTSLVLIVALIMGQYFCNDGHCFQKSDQYHFVNNYMSDIYLVLTISIFVTGIVSYWVALILINFIVYIGETFIG